MLEELHDGHLGVVKITYYKIGRVVELQVKAKGSWVTLDTLTQNIRVLPTHLFTTTQKFLLVCLVGKFACIQEYCSFCVNRPFSLHAT